MNVTSILLAGGQNKRMNYTPKWDLPFGGEKLLERSVRKLTNLSNDMIIVSGGDYRFQLEAHQQINLQIIYDKTPFLGPLNGLLTGLLNSMNKYNFVVASDMPFFSEKLAKDMYSIATEKNVDLIIPCWNNKLQPLHGIYSKEMLSTIQDDLFHGRNSIVKWIEKQENKMILDEKELSTYTDDGMIFFNMNNDNEYKLALERFSKEENGE